MTPPRPARRPPHAQSGAAGALATSPRAAHGRRRARRRGGAALALVLLPALALPALAAAQGGADDWAMVEPALGVASPLAGGFGPEWAARPGAAARLEAPAYGGRARLALRVAGYEAARPDLPAFSAVTALAGWGPSVALGAGVRGGAGLQVGAVRYAFDDGGEFGGFLQNETEAAWGAWLRLDAPLAGRLRVWAEAEALRVALADPATVATASAGLALRLDAPAWLRAVLR
ncbi:hypothetical protein RQM47_05440 [Rubrivirga sp. S365]|uniref:Uncharacterized protein n=1 Tax=Rubrivirga litoralis TaxID=3075598 RepID=A0ABU3BR45_9BACT|nr:MULTISPECIES: hypothetical protein [unclassified Rubrivirga]MDT0631758.1 hypothetical protein [Rubrivirga sp. F394]MDT7856077.1 hypothetical protein [Rubrivirga sp. S365]